MYIFLHFGCCNPLVVGLPPTKFFETSRNGLLQSHIHDDLGRQCKVHSPLTHLFNCLEPFHIASINHSVLISLQLMVKLFFSNRIIDILHKWLSIHLYKVLNMCSKTFWSGSFLPTDCNCLHRLDGMKSCSRFCCILVTAVHFTDQNWIS